VARLDLPGLVFLNLLPFYSLFRFLLCIMRPTVRERGNGSRRTSSSSSFWLEISLGSFFTPESFVNLTFLLINPVIYTLFA
jgi:hypothetical protein